jgi:hypothetical protein
LYVGIEKGKHCLCKSWPALSSLPRRCCRATTI